jgi:hypothetical protein
MLDCQKPCTTCELLDITTNHTYGKEAVGAVFTDGRGKGKAKREDQDEGPSSGQGKRKKKDRRRPNPNMIAYSPPIGITKILSLPQVEDVRTERRHHGERLLRTDVCL